MTEQPENPASGSVSAFLIRRYGGAAPETAPESAVDENDLAGFAHGHVLPAQRDRIERALAADPGLAEAVAFERGHREASLPAAPRFGLRAAAIAAALLIAATLPFVLSRSETAPDTSGPTVADLSDFDALPEDALRALEAEVVRRGAPATTGTPRILAPWGLILTARPTVVLHPGTEATTLTLYGNRDQTTVLQRRIEGALGAAPVRIPYPADQDGLTPDVRYGIDLRDGDGVLLATANFMIATPALQDLCSARREVLETIAMQVGPRSLALGNLYLRHDLFVDALESLRQVPSALRDAYWTRVVRVARRQLHQ